MKKITQGILIAACLAFGLILWLNPLKGKEFGPAAYYYSDIPQWQTKLYPQGVKLTIDGGLVLAIVLSLVVTLIFILLLRKLEEKPGKN